MLKQSNVIGLGSIIAMAICAYVMRDTEHLPAMLVWVGMNTVLSSVRWAFVYQPINRRYKAGGKITRRDHTVYHLVRFLLVSMWAVGGYLFLPSIDDPEVFIAFIIMFAGVLTSAAQNNTTATTQLPLIYIFPVTSGLTIRMLELGYFFFAGIMVMHMIYVSSLVISISKLEKRARKAELENEDLLKGLTREKEKADRANTQKSNFLAAASHDLRQPLSSLGLFLYSHRLQLQKHDAIDLSTLDGADGAFSALQELLDSLTEISRLDEGSIGVSVQPVHLETLLAPVIEELKVVADKKGLRLGYVPSGLHVATDSGLLIRILRNLIGNAIKYTETGSVEISEVLDGSQLKLCVSDTGVGIAKQEQASIFDEYHQIANKKRQRSEGIGLGLSIVKRIAKLLDHPITVSSELGHGSSFSLTLPLCSESNLESVSRESKITLMAGVRVLVVDDELDALDAMRSVLQNWGCVVDIAGTPEQARKLMELAAPQIVLCDYRLHESINGVELVQSLKQEFDLDIPCIIISADKSDELVKNVKKYGFPLIDKPVNIAVFNKLLNSLLS
jgi:signal transduction histidine kinase/CheY-like chemotaxis protein